MSHPAARVKFEALALLCLDALKFEALALLCLYSASNADRGLPRRPRVGADEKAEILDNLLGMVSPGASSGGRSTSPGVVE
jgi:hypothetical protein